MLLVEDYFGMCVASLLIHPPPPNPPSLATTSHTLLALCHSFSLFLSLSLSFSPLLTRSHPHLMPPLCWLFSNRYQVYALALITSLFLLAYCFGAIRHASFNRYRHDSPLIYSSLHFATAINHCSSSVVSQLTSPAILPLIRRREWR